MFIGETAFIRCTIIFNKLFLYVRKPLDVTKALVHWRQHKLAHQYKIALTRSLYGLLFTSTYNEQND